MGVHESPAKGAKRDEILCRAYGVPTKPSNTVFQNLDDRVVMKHQEIPVIKDHKKSTQQTGCFQQIPRVTKVGL